MAQGPMSSVLVAIRITVRTQESEVRNPDSFDYRITNGFYLNFTESCMGVARPTNYYILVTIRITIRIRESVPYHDPDPGRTATLSTCWRSAEVCAL